MSEADLEKERKLAHEKLAQKGPLSWHANPASLPLVVIFWTLVAIPLSWGIWQTLKSAAKLFI
jgi:hypothetical protein